MALVSPYSLVERTAVKSTTPSRLFRMRSIWHNMPRRSFALLLMAAFMTFLPIGFLIDISSLGSNSPSRLLVVVAFSGCIAVGYLYSFRIDRRFLPLVIAAQIAFTVGFNRAPSTPLRGPLENALQGRLTFDAFAAGSAMVCAYTCFMMLFRREGARYFRAHAEIALAHEIHKLLVPRVDAHIGRFEFCGASLPSGEVGGDLVDLVEIDGRWIGYLADVSGHGVGSGVLMGMVKSAARMRLLAAAPLAALLDDLNEALVPVRKPGMYVTMACLRYEEGAGLDFSLAGHLPLLHYRAATETVEERSIAHVPIAMFEGSRYASAPVPCDPGDLFVLMTDGLTEVFDAADRQLGLDPLKEAIRRGARLPLGDLLDALVATARAHGEQTDDQTVLLVRCS
jgi:stage II sporulation SpoE-like protein